MQRVVAVLCLLVAVCGKHPKSDSDHASRSPAGNDNDDKDSDVDGHRTGSKKDEGSGSHDKEADARGHARASKKDASVTSSTGEVAHMVSGKEEHHQSSKHDEKTRAAHMPSKSHDKEFVLLPNLVCLAEDTEDRQDQIKRFDHYQLNFAQCEKECLSRSWCAFFEMECGSQCVLKADCRDDLYRGFGMLATKFADSACHSYIGYHQSRNEKVATHLQARARTEKRVYIVPIMLVVVGSIAMFIAANVDRYHGFPALLGAEPRTRIPTTPASARENSVQAVELAAVEFQMLGSDEADDMGVDFGTTDVHTADPFGGWCSILFTTFGFLWCVYLTAMPLKEQDAAPRGFCGLVKEDRSPVAFKDLFTGQSAYFMHHGRKTTGLEVMPQTCWRVLEEDRVTAEIGPECLSWCVDSLGVFPRPLCALLGVFGPMYRTCLKTRLWDYVHRVPAWLSDRRGCWMTSISYGVVSLLVAWWNARDNKTRQTNPPCKDMCAPQNEGQYGSPYANKRQFVLGWQFPSNDHTVAKRRLTATSVSKLADPTFDVNCMLTFLFSGQPFYAVGMFVAIFVPNVNDPFQTRGSEMFFSSLDRGYAVKGMYVISQRTGSYEGVLSLFVALHALMRRAYVSNNVTGAEFVAVALSALSSLFSSLPAAAIARDLLVKERNQDLNFDDFYRVEYEKDHFGTRKYLPSLDCLSLGVAVAVTFQSNEMLITLYAIGVIVGIVWWLFYWQLYQCGGGLGRVPSVNGALSFVVTFLCWFMAPTRLQTHPEVQDALFLGTCPWHQAALYGCASLFPPYYYFHRIATLSIFWVWISLVSYNGFFTLVYNSIVKQDGENLVVAALIVSGWVSLFFTFVIFLRHRESFNRRRNKWVHRRSNSSVGHADCIYGV